MATDVPARLGLHQSPNAVLLTLCPIAAVLAGSLLDLERDQHPQLVDIQMRDYSHLATYIAPKPCRPCTFASLLGYRRPNCRNTVCASPSLDYAAASTPRSHAGSLARPSQAPARPSVRARPCLLSFGVCLSACLHPFGRREHAWRIYYRWTLAGSKDHPSPSLVCHSMVDLEGIDSSSPSVCVSS